MADASDHRLMARALKLAEHGLYTTDPNPRVGCVLAKDGRVVGEGWTQPAGGAHAEIEALRRAGDAARGATAYVTLEPCSHHGRTPPCTEALVAAGVARVVFAVRDPNPLVSGGGAAALARAGIVVDSGVLDTAAAGLNAGFMKRMTRGLPEVTVKVAASLDGKVALGSGESKWITGEPARRDVQRLRARSSAILTGVGTVLADDPRLTVRDPGIDMLGRNPLRVVCDSQLRMPADAQLLREPGTTLVCTTSSAPAPRRAALEARGAVVCTVAAGADGRPDLESLLRELARRECNEVLVEAGPELSGRFLALGLADRLVVYVSPVALGAGARSMLALPGIDRMADRLEFRLAGVRHVGEDLRLEWRPRPPAATHGPD